MALRHQGRNLATRSAHALRAIVSHDTANPHARQRHAAFTPVSRSPVARRRTNAPSTKAAQIRMAPPHHGRNLATRSAHTLQAFISHDTGHTPRLRQRGSRSPVARHHASALPPAGPRNSAWRCDIVLPTHNKHSYHTIPATRRVYASMFRAPQWRGATQTHLPPPRPRKLNPRGTAMSRTSFGHAFCPRTTSNRITRYRQSSRSPATRRVYTSMFRAPQWHGATQTHLPPRPRKSAWRCDITDVIWPRVLPTNYKQSYHTISATCRVYVSMFRAPQWHGATKTHLPRPRPRKSA